MFTNNKPHSGQAAPSLEDARRKREVAESLLRGNGRNPTTLAGGIGRVGEVLGGAVRIYGAREKEAEAKEAQGSKYAEVVKALHSGQTGPETYARIGNSDMSPAQMEVVNFLLQQEGQDRQNKAGLDTYRQKKQIDRQFAPAPKRQMVRGADNNLYYVDTREPVLPGVSKPEDPMAAINRQRAQVGLETDQAKLGQLQNPPQYSQITGDAAAEMGLNPQNSYNRAPSGQISQIGGAGTKVTVNNAASPQAVPEYPKLDRGLVYKREPQTGQVVINDEGAPIAIPIEGAPLDAQRKREEQAAATKQKTQKTYANIVLDDIGRADNLLRTEGFYAAGLFADTLAQIPDTDAHQLSKYLDTIKANAGFDKLQAMRDSSPTGGALGQVSERELGFLQAAIGSLDQSQSAEELRYNLGRVEKIYREIVHGPQGQAQQSREWQDAPGSPGVRLRQIR